MIEVEGLTKYYGVYPAVSDVSFKVEEGEVVAFLGPNGAGKTTTMRILTSYSAPTSGKATIAGYDVWDESLDSRRHIGYQPETTPLYNELTVRQQLIYGARLCDYPASKIRSRVDDVMDQCVVTDRADTIIAKLSKGYRQRVGLGLAIVHDPPVIILDEPTIGLDPKQVVETRKLIKELGKDHTIMLSTHILPEAQTVCDRVIIISEGNIIAEDTPEELTAQIRSARTLRVRIAGTDPTFASKLRDVGGVDAVSRTAETGDGSCFEIETPIDGDDMRAEIARFVVAGGYDLLEMTTVEMTLEDVFLRLTTDEGGEN
ncbi:MAG TPA: ABC transporter ATP-binding protein [Armatimonadota bacterium]|nr:ABC transporter ATP-binding protein [Armatimonadota bacterium]